MSKPLNENIQHVRVENEQGDLLPIMDAAGAKFAELVNAVTANNPRIETAMNLKLFYDTETTGLPDFKAPSESAHQPHIVQLAALLVDMDTRETIQSMDVIIRPDGWTIPDEVAAVHGITTQHALDVGIPESLAVSMFMELWNERTRIAHNEQFDARILRIALMRHQGDIFHSPSGKSVPDIWKEGKAECTAQMATPICQIPPTAKMVKAGFNKFKTPNLGEAYRHFTGKELVNAHSAMADVMACRDVYFEIKGAQQ